MYTHRDVLNLFLSTSACLCYCYLVFMNVKKVLHEQVIVLTVMYGSESWVMKVPETETECV